MADGSHRSQTLTETWQDQPPGTSTIHLIPCDIAKLPGQSCAHTSQTTREGAGPAEILESTSARDIHPGQPLSESNLHRLDDRNENYELCSSENETSNMVFSPEGSLRESSDAEVSPQTKPRGVTYAPSASSPPAKQKPFRQDSAYFSTRGPCGDSPSESDSDIEEQQLRARERVVILRRKVLKTRQVKRKKRDSLRQLRERVRVILDRLTQKINELVALNKIPEEITPYYDELRAAQDELGPAEDEYERLENRLDNEEEDLEEEEQRYYELYQYSKAAFDVSIQGSRIEQTISPTTKPYDVSNAEIQTLDLENTLLQDYLSMIDEALAIRKELQNLEDDYILVSEDANIRRRNGFLLFATMTTFLSEYPKSRAEILENLYRAEDQLLDLREECLKQGVFGRNEYPYEPRDALRDDLMEAVEEALERSPLRVAAQQLKHPKTMKEGSSKKDYVNSWLLQWVQDSTVDMMMLRTFIYIACPELSHTPQKTLVELGDDKWTNYSLANWFTDAAGDLADFNYNASRLDNIAGATNKLNLGSTDWSLSTGSSLNVGLDYDRLADPIIMGSEAASYTTQKLDLDTTPTKPSPYNGGATPTRRDLDNTLVDESNLSENHSTPPTSISEPTSPSIQAPFVVSLSPTMSYGYAPPPHTTDPLHLLIPNTSNSTSRRSSLRSNAVSFSTSTVPSLRSARTSIDIIEPVTAKLPISPSHKPESFEPRTSKSAFLNTPPSAISRSSSLTTSNRPAHHLARRSFELMTEKFSLHSMGKSASFTND
ncbi:hypothetical protein BKA65DRAFT_501543 [Rhexocercosporidium sp. MPI-PUGE-AT-0058]|nr:hypothetical protein BKA65DRAFT_501543 [Rhexocercosporidium sp. MPI-PUGE-AT-0058]